MHEWLDTETKSILCREPPEKTAPPQTEGYSLLLLEKGTDERRIDEVVAAIQRGTPAIPDDRPFVIARQLCLDDALAGQFALACCDCVTAFVRDAVICDSDCDYLRQLYGQVMGSPEFASVLVELLSVPVTDDGRRFCWQFLGLATPAVPATFRVFRKKARLMEHWAKKTGVVVRVVGGGP